MLRRDPNNNASYFIASTPFYLDLKLTKYELFYYLVVYTSLIDLIALL